jgi:hypothetical protein
VAIVPATLALVALEIALSVVAPPRMEPVPLPSVSSV